MRRTRLLVSVLTVLATVVPLSAPGVAQARTHPQVTVMSRNLYLGADLNPAIAAGSQGDLNAFLGAVAGIYGTVLANDFPARAGALAAEIAADEPDLVGLQEVSRWTVLGAEATVPGLDFLAILQAQLVARGLEYEVAVVSDNANIGPVPLVGPFCAGAPGSCVLVFQDRDVILVNNDRDGLTVGNPRHGNYANQLTVNVLGTPLSFARGWTSVDASLEGRSFRFANTHLETEAAAAAQQAQGIEFLAATRTKGPVVAVGDFNSAADGSTTTTYAFLTSDFYRDAARDVGATCCQNGTLSNATSQLSTRIDLVLTHGAAVPVGAHRVGAAHFQEQAPFWASDHAGVVATLRLP